MAVLSKWAWFKAIVGVVATFIAALFFWLRGRASAKFDEASATLQDDRKRLREAEETGDDDTVLREWRNSRGGNGNGDGR